MSMHTIYLYLDTAIGCSFMLSLFDSAELLFWVCFFTFVSEKNQLAVDEYAYEIPSLLKEYTILHMIYLVDKADVKMM